MSKSTGKPSAAPSGFVAQLIAALEEAQAQAAQPKPTAQLAQAAWDKLQFDFPVVSQAELAALVQEYASGTRHDINSRFLAVLRESAGAAPPAGDAAAAAAATAASSSGGAGGSDAVVAAAGGAGSAGAAASGGGSEYTSDSGSGSGSGSKGLVPLYQQLYALSVIESLRTCLQETEAAAAAHLAGLQPAFVGLAGSGIAPELNGIDRGDGEGGGGGDEADVAAEGGRSQLEEVMAAAAAAGLVPPELDDSGEELAAEQQDDDDLAYEPLEPAHLAPSSAPAAAAAAAATTPPQLSQQQPQGGDLGRDLPALLARLADHLSYHCMADAAAWREHRLMTRLAACLSAAQQHACFMDIQASVAQPLVRLATDRLVAAPAEVESSLPALLDALGVAGAPVGAGGGSSSGSITAASSSSQGLGGGLVVQREHAAAAAELAVAAAVALAAQLTTPSARRRLWQEVHHRLLPVAAAQLEAQQVALARAAQRAGARAGAAAAGSAAPAAAVQPTPQQLYSIMLPCQLLYFYILHAPPALAGSKQLQEAVLRGGLLRSLVLLFVQLGGQPGAEPLRCALLLACAAAQPLADWAAAVPGFTAATAAPHLQPGGGAQLHGALWRLLLAGSGDELATLLADATPAAKVPGIYQSLQLLADVQAVARRPQPLWGTGLDAALRQLGGTLRQLYSKPAVQQAEEESHNGTANGGSAAAAAGTASGARSEGAGKSGRGRCESDGDEGESGGYESGSSRSSDSSEDNERRRLEERERERRKLGVGAEEQAELLAARRAQQLQPACLKLIKDLLQRQAGSGKHD